MESSQRVPGAGVAPPLAAGAGRRALVGASRLHGLAGIGFVVLFVVGFMMVNTPGKDDSDDVWRAFFANHGHQAQLLISAFLITAAALCLVAFLITLWHRFSAFAEPRLSPIPLATAAMGCALIALGGTIQAAVAGGVIFGQLREPPADVLRYADTLSFPIITVGGMWAVAATILGLTIQGRRLGHFGTTMTVFGVLGILGGIAAFLFFPLILVLIWVIAATVWVFRHGATA